MSRSVAATLSGLVARGEHYCRVGYKWYSVVKVVTNRHNEAQLSKLSPPPLPKPSPTQQMLLSPFVTCKTVYQYVKYICVTYTNAFRIIIVEMFEKQDTLLTMCFMGE